MKYHKLGSSDITVPMCCLGTMTWGEQNTAEEAMQQLDYALEHGVNFIDTAEVYPVPIKAETASVTESIIGEWLATRGVREKVIIASKVSGPTPTLDRTFITKNRYCSLTPVEMPSVSSR
jgi:aryl-alcohol dehydrogenase-like predicted oxidoreductase